MRLRSNDKAFAIIETLVAITILGIISAAILTQLVHTIKLTEEIEAKELEINER